MPISESLRYPHASDATLRGGYVRSYYLKGPRSATESFGDSRRAVVGRATGLDSQALGSRRNSYAVTQDRVTPCPVDSGGGHNGLNRPLSAIGELELDAPVALALLRRVVRADRLELAVARRDQPLVAAALKSPFRRNFLMSDRKEKVMCYLHWRGPTPDRSQDVADVMASLRSQPPVEGEQLAFKSNMALPERDSVVPVAWGDLKCTGGYCGSGGTSGTTGMYSIGGRPTCRDCAIKILGLEKESPATQIKELLKRLK